MTMSVEDPDPAAPSFAEAVRVWAKIGLMSFGGPAGQIALMHRMLVDEKRWVSEPRLSDGFMTIPLAGSTPIRWPRTEQIS